MRQRSMRTFTQYDSFNSTLLVLANDTPTVRVSGTVVFPAPFISLFDWRGGTEILSFDILCMVVRSEAISTSLHLSI